jgi:cell division protein FtsW
VRTRAATPVATVDRSLVMVTVGLCAFGLVMVFSSSESLGWNLYHNSSYFFQRQLVWMGLGLAALWLAARTDYHEWRRVVLPLVAITAVLLVAVLLPHVGQQRAGARRWLSFGGQSLQPAELAKLAVIVGLACWLERRGARVRSLVNGLVPFLVLMGGAIFLIILERDLGTTFIIISIFLAQFLVAGARKHHLALLTGATAFLLYLFVAREPYRVQRLLSFLNPWSDQLNSGFQSVQAILALGSGGLTGVGLGHSAQKYQWLPEPHTDFIFAIIGEETGMLGASAVLLAFGWLAYRGYRAALRAPDALGLLLATGITTWLAAQALVNIAAVTGTLPTTGIPLPFISYGGSSLAISLLAMGILLNVSAQGQKVGLQRDAGVDIGRGNRRTHLSRGRRGAGVAS